MYACYMCVVIYIHIHTKNFDFYSEGYKLQFLLNTGFLFCLLDTGVSILSWLSWNILYGSGGL